MNKWTILTLFIFLPQAVAGPVAKELLGGLYPGARSAAAFDKKFGAPLENRKGIRKYKFQSTIILAHVENGKVTKAQYRFWRSPITIKNSNKHLEKYKELSPKGHAAGRNIFFFRTFQDGEEILVFNKNSKKNLNSVTIKWKD